MILSDQNDQDNIFRTENLSDNEVNQIFRSLEVTAAIWHSKSSDPSLTMSCPICDLLYNQINKHPEDPCYDCPISQYNGDKGCPEMFLNYKNINNRYDKMESAYNIARYIDIVSDKYYNNVICDNNNK